MKKNAVKRRLFFDDDEEITHYEPVAKSFKSVLEEHEQTCQRRWNFNFRLGQPLYGPIKWAARNPSIVEDDDQNNSAENDENNYSTLPNDLINYYRERKYVRPVVRKTLIFVGEIISQLGTDSNAPQTAEHSFRQTTGLSTCSNTPRSSVSSTPDIILPNISMQGETSCTSPQTLKMSLAHTNSTISTTCRETVKRKLDKSATLTDYFRISKKKQGGK